MGGGASGPQQAAKSVTDSRHAAVRPKGLRAIARSPPPANLRPGFSVFAPRGRLQGHGRAAPRSPPCRLSRLSLRSTRAACYQWGMNDFTDALATAARLIIHGDAELRPIVLLSLAGSP